MITFLKKTFSGIGVDVVRRRAGATVGSKRGYTRLAQVGAYDLVMTSSLKNKFSSSVRALLPKLIYSKNLCAEDKDVFSWSVAGVATLDTTTNRYYYYYYWQLNQNIEFFIFIVGIFFLSFFLSLGTATTFSSSVWTCWLVVMCDDSMPQSLTTHKLLCYCACISL